MSSEEQLELWRAHRSGQDRYDYFLLAAAGAAIAFALNQTHDKALNWTQIPLGIAVLLWGLSFFFGCRRLVLVSSALYSNGELLQVKSGKHPMTGMNPDFIQIAAGEISKNFDKIQDRTSQLSRWQFSCLIAGAVFYIVWHIIEMYLRVTILHH